jgi:hypothetical protein
MPIIIPSDLHTNIYPEIIEQITRGDSTITVAAISAAVQEAKMYLARYDLDQLFGTDTAAPSFTDGYLASIVKDIACWQLIRLCNTIDYPVYRSAYVDAVTTLKNIMSGQLQPSGWPYLDTSGENTPLGDTIDWNSNPKRNNYY